MTVEIITCEQGTPEWHAARLGIPTASEFSTVLAMPRAEGHLPPHIMEAMVKSGCSAAQLAAAVKAAKKKYSGAAATRREYMRKLVGEILTGEPTESYSNAHMERGKVMEDEARDLYAMQNDVEPERVGFIRNGQKGASPDSLIGKGGGLEIKTALPHIQIDRLLKNELPSEHVAQVQGNLWTAEREWWDFCSYWPKMPLLKVRVYRDEKFIAELSEAVDRFNDELQQVLATVRRYGMAPAKRKADLHEILAAG